MWCLGGPHREQARSHNGSVRTQFFERYKSPVGASLLAMGPSQATHHFGLSPGLTRNALAFASITKYITTVINNGRMK